jgi:DNA-binding CsgD family transcriptional regulator
MAGVVIVSARRANADALAACCRRRGLNAVVIEPGEVLPGADVVVLDLLHDAVDPVDAAGGTAGSGDGAPRLIGLGARRGDAGPMDAWVEGAATVEELIAAITGTERCTTGSSAARGSVPVTVSLTPREEHVLSELLAGGESAVMAGRLGISPETFRTHVQNLLAKLGVNNRAQAAVWALQNGMRPPRPERRAS